MSITILCVEKTGTIKEVELTSYNELELYKKAGFKTAQDFEFQTEWGADIDGKSYSVSVFGKTTGRSGQENKYDFPPPIDTTLLFGSCILVNKIKGVPSNLSKAEWKLIYEHLFGGFEDIGDEDSDEETEEDDLSDSIPITKEGYVKDGFIVEDDEDEEDYDDETEEENSEEEVVVVKKTSLTATKKKPTKPVQNKKKSENLTQNVFTIIKEESDIYLGCTSELSEEDYV